MARSSRLHNRSDAHMLQALQFSLKLVRTPLNYSLLDKETSFLDLNIKVIGSDIHISVYDTHDDF